MQIEIKLIIGLDSAIMALLSAASGNGLVAALAASAKPATSAPSAPSPTSQDAPSPDGSGSTAQTSASPSNDEGAPDIDAAGWPWDPAMHASTKGTTQEGLWRMKVGVKRPDAKSGFPKADGATSTEATTTTEAQSGDSAPAATVEEDDEFAAFRDAAAKTAEPVAVPARKWADADLGALCNQAATKLGDPSKVKALIAEFVPEGEVSHSRNIPAEKREEFAVAVEKAADITFAG